MPQEELTPVSIRNIGSSGVILEDIVDESLMPAGSVNWAVNLHFDRIGAATIRNGYTILEEQVEDTYSCLGLHQFLDTGTGTNDRLIGVWNTSAYALVSGTWTAKRTSLTASSKARFTNFIDLVFMVNGVDAMNSYDGGAGNFGTTSCTSAPAASYIENFRSRVWAAKTSAQPSRVYYSSIASGGAVAWTGSVGEGYIDVAPGDGEDVTGIKKFDGALWVAKPSTMYRVFSINESEPDARVFVGTYSQESMVTTKDGLYWHHSSGIYRVRKGEGTPTEISRPIYTIIQNISRSNYTEVGAWSDDDHVYFSVGDVSVNGVTIVNCILRWTISSEVWTIYSTKDRMLVGNTYDTSDGLYRVVADNDGYVYTWNNGATDNGTSVTYSLETRWYNISGLRSETKTIREFTSLSENLEGANLGWKNGTHSTSAIQPIGQIEKDEHTFKGQNITGKRIKFCLSGVGSGSRSAFQGIEINSYINEGVIE